MLVIMRKLAWIALLLIIVGQGCSLDWTVPGGTPECLMCVEGAAKGDCASDYQDCCGDPGCKACLDACQGADCECANVTATGSFIRLTTCVSLACSDCTPPKCGL